jgi:hypothetical protein
MRPNRFRARAISVFGIAVIFISGLLMSAQALKAPVTTPPMGWNSYDCWNYAVSESQFMQNAHYLANIKQYGWQYCIVDFIWWIPPSGAFAGSQNGNWNLGNMDQYGRFLPDTTRFPSAKGGKGFKALADSVHNLGMKFGLHLMRGVPRMAVHRNCMIFNSTYSCTNAANQNSNCPWMDWMWGTNSNAAGQAYLTSMVSLCNDWGVDYLKIDDLSASSTEGYHDSEVVMYGRAIAAQPREMVFSTSPGPTPLNKASAVSQWANMFRLVNDLWDTWGQLTNAYDVAESWRATSIKWGQGSWPDVDMLPFGHLALYGPVGNPRYSLSTFTKGEHRLMFLLWCVNNGPIMWGGNLPDNNKDTTHDNIKAPFYDSIMTNSDALFIEQHGIKARVIKAQSTGTPIWTSTHPLDTTTKFLLFGNTSSSSQSLSINLNTLGFSATQSVPVKSVWTGATVGNFTGTFSQTIPSHDASLYVLGSASMVWPTVKVQPVKSVEKPMAISTGNVYFATGDRFDIPAAFAGKTVKVSEFNLSGKLLNDVVTHDRSIKLYKNTSVGKITFVKITEVR